MYVHIQYMKEFKSLLYQYQYRYDLGIFDVDKGEVFLTREDAQRAETQDEGHGRERNTSKHGQGQDIRYKSRDRLFGFNSYKLSCVVETKTHRVEVDITNE